MNVQSENKNKTAALDYIKHGISVIPLKPKSKEPLIKWLEYKERLPTKAEISSWFRKWPNAKLAIVTGKISGLIVIDIDGEQGKATANDKLTLNDSTPIVKTGNGLHFYYKYPENGKRIGNFQCRSDLPGIDLRGDGGYVVCPPSVHENGTEYEWSKAIDETPFADFPVEILKSQSSVSFISKNTKNDDVLNGVPKGNRNMTLASLVGSWINNNYSLEEIMQLAIAWNLRNKPSMNVAEVEKTVNSIWKKVTSQTEIAPEEWQNPIPFDNFSELPDFPIDTISNIGQEMVKTVSEVVQIDMGFVATTYLGALSTCLSKKVQVDLNTHSEPVNIYTCSVLGSGDRKSATNEFITKPIFDYQKTKEKVYKKDLKEFKEQKAKQKNKKIKPNDNGVSVDSDIPPSRSTFVVDDITSERLGDLMALNGERMSVISAEGGIFRVMAGLYTEKGGTNIDLYLKGHSGDPWSCHRISREDQVMDNPALTMCLAVQPHVLREIGQNKQFKGCGLLARVLYLHGKSKVGYRTRQYKTVTDDLKKRYKEHIDQLLNLPLIDNVLKLTQDAQDAWDVFYNDIEADMRIGGGLSHLIDFGSKLAGNVARIAGLLHFAEYESQAIGRDISLYTMKSAIALGVFYREHALAIFDLMGENPEVESAKLILEFLAKHQLEHFKGRDVLRNKNALKTMKDVEPGLKILIERNYIRERVAISAKFGRPESTIYETNPKIKYT